MNQIPQPHETSYGLQLRSRGLFIMAVIMLVLLLVLEQRHDLSNSLHAIANGRPAYILLGICCTFLTFATAALSYKALIRQRMVYRQLLVVELAGSFATKLAPAGLGGIAVNTRFLTLQRYTLPEASSIVGVNNLVGFSGHMSLLVMLILFGQATIRDAFSYNLSISTSVWLLGGVLGLLAVGVVMTQHSFRHRIRKIIRAIIANLAAYRQEPLRLLAAYGASLLTTLLFSSTLYLSVIALGQQISPLQALVVFTVGVAAASVTPTPGGIGGAEAGLAAALIGTGLTAEKAIGIALLYRFITYWLPIVPGFIAFNYVSKKKYI